jgi:hypothetical protein
MAIQRAVVKGTIADFVNIRNMFTANVVESYPGEATALWTTYLTQFYGMLYDMLHTGSVFTSFEILQLNSGQWELVTEEAFSHAGTDTTQALANQVALVFIGKALGVKHIGRKFIGGLTENTVQINGLAASFVADAAQALIYYVSPVDVELGGTLTPGVVNKNNLFYPFVGGFVSTFLGSMRRRKPGVGS